MDILVQIGDVFPHLTEYNELFCQHPGVLLLVDEYTATILSFHTGLMEVFNKTGKYYTHIILIRFIISHCIY